MKGFFKICSVYLAVFCWYHIDLCMLHPFFSGYRCLTRKWCYGSCSEICIREIELESILW